MLNFYNNKILLSTEILNDGYNVLMGTSLVCPDKEITRSLYFNNQIAFIDNELDIDEFLGMQTHLALSITELNWFIMGWRKHSKQVNHLCNPDTWFYHYLKSKLDVLITARQVGGDYYNYEDAQTEFSIKRVLDKYDNQDFSWLKENNNVNFKFSKRLLKQDITFLIEDCLYHMKKGGVSEYLPEVNNYIRQNLKHVKYFNSTVNSIASNSTLIDIKLTKSKNYDNIELHDINFKDPKCIWCFQNPLRVPENDIINTSYLKEVFKAYNED